MRNIALFCVLLFCVQALFAQEQLAEEQIIQDQFAEEQLPGGAEEQESLTQADNPAESGESNAGVVSSSSFTLQISTLPEAKLGFTQRFIIPFLQGESPLTTDNNINIGLSGEVSPISLNGIVEAVWTPIAFFMFSLGGKAGSGWYLEPLNAVGIGINRADDITGNAELDTSPFDGLLWKVHAGGTIQMDLAALIPGDWNHIVIQSYHEINYKGYSRAQAGESWYFENDFGENCNGLNYYGNLTIGYQMPQSPVLNAVALRAEGDLYLYDSILSNRSKWGDERMRWTFSAIYNFAISKKFNLMVIGQLRTLRNYTDTDWEDLYYRNRTIDTDTPLRLVPYRVAAVLSYKL